MIGIRTTALCAALGCVLALGTGCSSSGGTKPTTSGTASTTSAAGSAAPASAGAAALAATLRKGLSGLTSAHVNVDAGTLGGRSEGDVVYSNGTATASDITVTGDGGKTELVTVGSTTYGKLPAGQNTSGKPWVKVTTASKNEFVRALAGNLDLSKAAASLPAVADLAATSSSVTKNGNTYALEVQPGKVSGSSLASLLASVGQPTVPVQLTLDGKGRPTDITITFKIGSQSLAVKIVVSRFDAPLKISAPPASQVAS